MTDRPTFAPFSLTSATLFTCTWCHALVPAPNAAGHEKWHAELSEFTEQTAAAFTLHRDAIRQLADPAVLCTNPDCRHPRPTHQYMREDGPCECGCVGFELAD